MPAKRRTSKVGGQIPHQQVRVSLPRDYPWRVMDKLLTDVSHDLKKQQVAHVRRIIRNRDERLLGKLAEAWSPQSMTLWGTDPREFAAKYQLASLLKKYRFPSDNNRRKNAALTTFRLGEVSCTHFNLIHSKKLAYLTDETELECFTHSRWFLSRLLGEILPPRSELTEWSRHGPGANLDTKNGRTSLYDKYKNWPYSCTKDALRYARLSIMDDERWYGALVDDYRNRNGIPQYAIVDQDRFWNDVFTVVPGNRIAFVPKNAKTDRTIAIEPAMNLYLQLGVDGFIRRRLKRYGVDLDSQEKNKELARRGSKDHGSDDPFVTLDLAAASDSISTEVCRLLLPPQWYAYLMALRSPYGCCEGETFKYEKISSMGNGYTFALESLIFLAVIYGVQKVTHGSFNRDEVAVFGDDLIVRKSVSELVTTMLNRCGFQINHEKSFLEGPFRESCGADWFRGAPVRPVFLDEEPRTAMALWCDINRIRRILSLRGWGYGSNVSHWMERWIPDKLQGITGPFSDESFDSYLHVPKPCAKYAHGLWTFPLVIVRYKRGRAPSFFFRKLMHSLRSQPESITFSQKRWGGVKVSVAGAGSRFTVHGKSVAVSLQYSQTSIWPDEYCEAMPDWPPRR